MSCWRKKFIMRSRYGYPVPSPAKVADQTELNGLIAKAKNSGFSRTARGLTPQDSEDYVLMPYLPEPTPAPAWICMVVGISPALFVDSRERPRLSFAKLDVALRDFKKLHRLSRIESEQLLHWMSREASRRDS